MQQKTFAQSVKARTWTADGGDFSGIFAQHAPPAQQQPQQLEGDDNFGEFQSVGSGIGVGPTDNLTTLVEPSGRPQASSQIVDLQDIHARNVQPSQHNIQQSFQGQFPGGNVPHTQVQVPGALIHNSNTVPTSSYQHPIASTSVTQKPQSPTGMRYSSLDPSKFPPLYTKVFERCSRPGEPFMITELLFPLLSSSQLPRNVLRDLWSLANREVPGKLNQTELYVLLGLIALAQVNTSCFLYKKHWVHS